MPYVSCQVADVLDLVFLLPDAMLSWLLSAVVTADVIVTGTAYA